MIVYNITSKIESSALQEWLNWVQKEHVPEILATKHFDTYKIFRLLGQSEDDEPTYVIQYTTTTKERYLEYINGPAYEINRRTHERWGDRQLSYHTYMERVQ